MIHLLGKLRQSGGEIKAQSTFFSVSVLYDVKCDRLLGLRQLLGPLGIFSHHHDDIGAGDSLNPFLRREGGLQSRPGGEDRYFESHGKILKSLGNQRQARVQR